MYRGKQRGKKGTSDENRVKLGWEESVQGHVRSLSFALKYSPNDTVKHKHSFTLTQKEREKWSLTIGKCSKWKHYMHHVGRISWCYLKLTNNEENTLNLSQNYVKNSIETRKKRNEKQMSNHQIEMIN